MAEAEIEWVPKTQDGGCRWAECTRQFGFEHAKRRRREARCRKRKDHQLAVPDKMRGRKGGPSTEEERTEEELREDDHTLVHWALAAATNKLGEVFHMFECTEQEWDTWNKAPGSRLKKKRVRWGASSMLSGCEELHVEEGEGRVKVHGPADSIKDLLSLFANAARLKGEEMKVSACKLSDKLQRLDLRKIEEREIIEEEQQEDELHVWVEDEEETARRKKEEEARYAAEEAERSRLKEKRRLERWRERVESGAARKTWLAGTLTSDKPGAVEGKVTGSKGEYWCGGGDAEEAENDAVSPEAKGGRPNGSSPALSRLPDGPSNGVHRHALKEQGVEASSSTMLRGAWRIEEGEDGELDGVWALDEANGTVLRRQFFPCHREWPGDPYSGARAEAEVFICDDIIAARKEREEETIGTPRSAKGEQASSAREVNMFEDDDEEETEGGETQSNSSTHHYTLDTATSSQDNQGNAMLNAVTTLAHSGLDSQAAFTFGPAPELNCSPITITDIPNPRIGDGPVSRRLASRAGSTVFVPSPTK